MSAPRQLIVPVLLLASFQCLSCSTSKPKASPEGDPLWTSALERNPATTDEPVDCSKPENANRILEIEKLAKGYYALLGQRSSGRLKASSPEPARKEARSMILYYLHTHDHRSCFKGIADISVLCPQLQVGSPLLEKTVTGSAFIRSGDFTWFKPYLQDQGRYSKQWILKGKSGTILANAIDQNDDGFIDEVRLSEGTTLERYENTKWIEGMRWKVIEGQTRYGGMTTHDLTRPPYSEVFSRMSLQDRCLSQFANPVEIVQDLSTQTGWSAEKTYLELEQAPFYDLVRGSWSGTQKGLRAWVTGVNRSFNGTKEMFTVLGRFFYDGAKIGRFMVASLGQKAGQLYQECLNRNDDDEKLARKCFVSKAGEKMLEELAEVDKKIEAGFYLASTRMADAAKILGGDLQSVIQDCLLKNYLNPILSNECIRATLSTSSYQKIGKPVVEWIEGALKEKVAHCFLTSAEDFAECMGSISFYATSAAAGAAIKAGSVKLALTGGPVARVAGRAGIFVAEWIVDQVGVTSFTKDSAAALESTLKAISQEGMQLIRTKGALSGLTDIEANALLEYLSALARHEADPLRFALPELEPGIRARFQAAAPQLLPGWEERVRSAVAGSPLARTQVKTTAQAEDYLKSQGFDGASAKRLATSVMANPEFNGLREQTLAVLTAIGPKKLADPVQRNAVLGALKDLSRIYGGTLDTLRAAGILGNWDKEGITGLLMLLHEAKQARVAGQSIEESMKKVLRSKAPQLSDGEIDKMVRCARPLGSF